MFVTKPNFKVRCTPIEGEPPRDWADRFSREVGMEICSMAFLVVDRYFPVSIKSLKGDNNMWDAWASIKDATSEMEPSSWYVTADMTAWFQTEDQAVVFKLCWR